MNNNDRLTRSRTDRVIAGVCAGLARYFEVDPMIVRALFVLLIFIPGPSIILYFILWLIMPQEGSQAPTHQAFKENLTEIKGQAERVIDRVGLRRGQQQAPGGWRYDPYTGQPIDQQRDQNGNVQ